MLKQGRGGIRHGRSEIAGTIPDELVYNLSEGAELGVATGKDALAYGGSWFAKTANKQLVNEQVRKIAGARFAISASIGNVPLPKLSTIKDTAKTLWNALWDSDENPSN